MPYLKHATGKYLTLSVALSLLFTSLVKADFVNGGFEDPYTADNTAHSPITGWTQSGYIFNGDANSSTPPSNLSQINITPATTPGGISDIIFGTVQTVSDYFLYGATPSPTLLLPNRGNQTASVNLRSVDNPLTVSGTSGKPTAWTHLSKQATSFSQSITLTTTDIDPVDGIIHVRFKVGAVLENPVHGVNEKPFYVAQVINNTTGGTTANPLFFQWRYAAQPGVPWKALTTAGTNSGGNIDYEYLDWQAFDIAPGNAFMRVGDQITLTVLASGCSRGGHDGHVYLDDVYTYIPPVLWVTATGPQSSTPGQNITYTYRYTNAGTTAINNVEVVATPPVQGTPGNANPQSTTFVSSTTPTVGTATSCTGTAPVTCTMGTLQPGQTGTFQITFNIPAGWATTTGPVNNGNYPISGSGVNPLLGPLVQTNLVNQSALSNLIAGVNFPPTATLGQTYTGSFTCTNKYPNPEAVPADAPNASCDAANLPTGVRTTGCTISPNNVPWVEPATIPAGQTVTCNAVGIPTTTGVYQVLVATDAANNGNTSTNRAEATVTVTAPTPLVNIPATVNGSAVFNSAVVCCGRPVILGPLPIPGPGNTNYSVIGRTGNVNCYIGQTSLQTYLKVSGNHGFCTIVGVKNGIASNPLTIVSP